ncbi:GNAT family N-acetyltransferase [Rossellomorea aquimaris]|uniref:RimJ/RimL family protein N-acetyltransferase n=1 Tax=Rossellomorea aquimaris TaxID=189382 RepID=A0A366EMR8_9BACI|nr:GNAT family protein [Rossellomorea aquimaris]RBP03732.1 RimJ/RimL family protein N-acetyltransferase [Rossellomorea aquimaris]
MEEVYLFSHIYLRRLKKEDWKDVHLYASQENVSQFQPWGPNSEMDTLAYVEEVLKAEKMVPQTRYVQALVDENTDRVIGAGEIIIKSFVHQSGEIGYILHPDYWGKGIGTLLGSALVERGFSELNLHKISATCDPQNISSQKVLTKIGMTLEGRIRHDLKMKNGWRDSLLFGLLEDEWTKGGKNESRIGGYPGYS